MRMAQRQISQAEIDYVIQHGEKYYRAGAIHCYLRKRDIPLCDRHYEQYRKREGIIVLLDSHTVTVITVYRNRHRGALKKIRCKAKYNKK